MLKFADGHFVGVSCHFQMYLYNLNNSRLRNPHSRAVYTDREIATKAPEIQSRETLRWPEEQVLRYV